MLKKFAEKEKLKDHLLYLIKQDKKKRIDEKVIESTSNIIMKVMDVYEEMETEEGQDVASGYLFNIFANYIMMGLNTLDLNKELIQLNEELFDINEHLIEKLGEEDK